MALSRWVKYTGSNRENTFVLTFKKICNLYTLTPALSRPDGISNILKGMFSTIYAITVEYAMPTSVLYKTKPILQGMPCMKKVRINNGGGGRF